MNYARLNSQGETSLFILFVCLPGQIEIAIVNICVEILDYNCNLIIMHFSWAADQKRLADQKLWIAVITGWNEGKLTVILQRIYFYKLFKWQLNDIWLPLLVDDATCTKEAFFILKTFYQILKCPATIEKTLL